MSSIPQAIFAEAQRQGVDPSLALEVAQRESGLNQAAIGSSGEIGVFQLMPATAAQLGVDPTNLAQNIQGGIAYLRQMLAQFGDPAKALAAYNCGPGCVAAATTYGADWFSHIPSSTQSYVTSILGNVQTAYTAQLNPLPAIFPTTSTAAIPGAAPATSSNGIWWTLAIAAAVFFGVGLVLEQS